MRDLRCEERGLRNGGEGYEIDSLCEGTRHFLGDPKGKSGLAHAARTRQSHQPRAQIEEQLSHGGRLPLPADHGGGGYR